MSRLMREKFSLVRPVINMFESSFRTCGARHSSNCRNGSTTASRYLSRFASIHGLLLFRSSSRKKLNVPEVRIPALATTFDLRSGDLAGQRILPEIQPPDAVSEKQTTS